MDMDQIERIVDLLEGVSVFIANPVDMPDEMVFLPSGSLVLDGAKARTFLTYSEDDEPEIEKTDRREKFIQALLKGFGENFENISNPDVFELITDNINTNLSDISFSTFVEDLQELDGERMVFQRF